MTELFLEDGSLASLGHWKFCEARVCDVLRDKEQRASCRSTIFSRSAVSELRSDLNSVSTNQSAPGYQTVANHSKLTFSLSCALRFLSFPPFPLCSYLPTKACPAPASRLEGLSAVRVSLIQLLSRPGSTAKLSTSRLSSFQQRQQICRLDPDRNGGTPGPRLVQNERAFCGRTN